VYRKEVPKLERLTEDEANFRDEDGRTPLMHAILDDKADLALIKLLITRGADVNAADREQWTPLHFAARDGKSAVVQALLDAGASIDAPNNFGNTPLWELVMGPKTDAQMIKTLLQHGADPGKKNKNGVSPIDLARRTGQEDMLPVLEGRERPV
jgi:ankyrin repeat protein